MHTSCVSWPHRVWVGWQSGRGIVSEITLSRLRFNERFDSWKFAPSNSFNGYPNREIAKSKRTTQQLGEQPDKQPDEQTGLLR